MKMFRPAPDDKFQSGGSTCGTVCNTMDTGRFFKAEADKAAAAKAYADTGYKTRRKSTIVGNMVIPWPKTVMPEPGRASQSGASSADSGAVIITVSRHDKKTNWTGEPPVSR